MVGGHFALSHSGRRFRRFSFGVTVCVADRDLFCQDRPVLSGWGFAPAHEPTEIPRKPKLKPEKSARSGRNVQWPGRADRAFARPPRSRHDVYVFYVDLNEL